MSHTEIIDINIINLCLFFLIALVPALFINRFFLKLKINSKLILAFFRMVLQLLLAALYLTKLFKWDNPWFNCFYLLIMVIAASSSAIRHSSLRLRYFLPQLFISMLIPLVFTLAILLLGITRPIPILSARYLIPLGGMLLGNSLNSNITTLRSFFLAISTNQEVYHQRLMRGANRAEALRPWLLISFENAIAPIMATMASMGLVSLPGMMTGQLLQGAKPLTAVFYQIAIVIGIFIVQYSSILMTLALSIKFQFSPNNRLKINRIILKK